MTVTAWIEQMSKDAAAPHLVMREALHQDVLQAWQEYEKTGLHVTGDEAISWLETWGTDGETAAPQCHV